MAIIACKADAWILAQAAVIEACTCCMAFPNDMLSKLPSICTVVEIAIIACIAVV